MTDKELLELAAKAAGYVKKGEAVGSDDEFTHLVVNAGIGSQKFCWNPLTDDGDAMRLAVKLKLDVEFGNRYYFNEGPMTFCGTRWDSNECTEFRRFVMHKGDPEAATRRAITRAAAEIGKAKK